MRKNVWMAGALTAVAIASATPGTARALPVTVVASFSTYQLEALGFAGRMRYQTPNVGTGSFSLSGTLGGVTSDGQFAYFSGSSTGSSFTQISKVSLTTSQAPTTINVARGLSDIAISNGQLFGVVDTPSGTNLEIVKIAADGTTSPFLTLANAAPASGKWRLSGVVAGNTVFAVKGRSVFDAPPANARTVYEFDATTAASTFSFAPTNTAPIAAGQIGDMVIESGTGTTVLIPSRQSSPLTQPRMKWTNGVGSETLSAANQIGASLASATSSLVSSDEFVLAYDASSPAQVVTSLTGGTSFDRLYRNPILWSASVTAGLANGLKPDGVTMSSVASATPVVQSSGSSPITIVNTPAAPGTFAVRNIGTATAQLDLSTAQAGVYTLATGALTGTYNTEAGRSIFTAQRAIRSFAYEPVSTNIAGNGAIELDTFGWDSITSGGFVSRASSVTDLGDHSLWMTPSSGSPAVVRQLMELPVSSGAMLFQFDYRVDSFPNAPAPLNITATLGGTTIANFDVNVSMADYARYSTLIDIPTLYGQSNVELRFTVTGGTWTYLDNIALVPEPGTFSTMAIGGLLLRRRRMRERSSR